MRGRFGAVIFGAAIGTQQLFSLKDTLAFTDSKNKNRVLMWGKLSALPLEDGYSAPNESCLRAPSLFPFFEKHTNVKHIAFGPFAGCSILENGELYFWGSIEKWSPEYGPDDVVNDGNPIPPFLRPKERFPTQHIAPRKLLDGTEKALFMENGLLVLMKNKTVLYFPSCRDIINSMADNKPIPSAETVSDLPVWNAWKLSFDEVKDISVGANHFLILTKQGKVFARGHNNYGQCGVSFDQTADDIKENTIEKLIQVKFPKDISKIVQISSGFNHNICLDDKGQVVTFGDDRKIQLLLGDTRSSKSGVISNTQHMKWVEAVEKGLVLPSSSIVSYGTYDVHAQHFPTLVKEPPVPSGRPVKYPPADLVVAAGDSTFMRHRDSPDWYPAALTTNVLFAGGENLMGQCGRSIFKQQQNTAEVLTPARVFHEEIACGSSHCLALLGSGHIFGWGSNEDGALAAPTNKAIGRIEEGTSTSSIPGGQVVCPPRHIPMPNEKRVRRTDMTTFVGRASRLHSLGEVNDQSGSSSSQAALMTVEGGKARRVFSGWDNSAASVEFLDGDKQRISYLKVFATEEEAMKEGDKAPKINYVELKHGSNK